MKRLIALFLVCVTLLLSACSTAPDDPSQETTAQTTTEVTTTEITTTSPEEPEPEEPKDLILCESGSANYRIVVSATGASKTAGKAATKLIQAFKEETGILLPLQTDASTNVSATEILIGSTKRTPEVELKENQVGVSVLDEKIVIAAGTDEYLLQAVDLFMQKLKIKNGTATLSGDLSAKKTLREVITTFTVASYNIKNGEIVGHDFRILANDILESGASIVGLQEVDQKTGRNGYQDTMKLLSQYTGWEYYCYAPTIPEFSGGQYGIGILSQYPIVSFEYKSLPLADPDDEPRAVLYAEIDMDGETVHFFNTHCGGSDIPDQIKTIADWTEKFDSYIVTGDFNHQNFTTFYSNFTDATLAVNAQNGLITTYDSEKQIDNIVASPGITIDSSWIDETENSDHKMPVATLTKKSVK